MSCLSVCSEVVLVETVISTLLYQHVNISLRRLSIRTSAWQYQLLLYHKGKHVFDHIKLKGIIIPWIERIGFSPVFYGQFRFKSNTFCRHTSFRRGRVPEQIRTNKRLRFTIKNLPPGAFENISPGIVNEENRFVKNKYHKDAYKSKLSQSVGN